jgi:hypothetical protein
LALPRLSANHHGGNKPGMLAFGASSHGSQLVAGAGPLFSQLTVEGPTLPTPSRTFSSPDKIADGTGADADWCCISPRHRTSSPSPLASMPESQFHSSDFQVSAKGEIEFTRFGRGSPSFHEKSPAPSTAQP